MKIIKAKPYEQEILLESERLRKQNKERFYDVSNDWVIELKLNRRAIRDYEVI